MPKASPGRAYSIDATVTADGTLRSFVIRPGVYRRATRRAVGLRRPDSHTARSRPALLGPCGTVGSVLGSDSDCRQLKEGSRAQAVLRLRLRVAGADRGTIGHGDSSRTAAGNHSQGRVLTDRWGSRDRLDATEY